MFLYTALLLALVCFSESRPQQPQQHHPSGSSRTVEPKQLLYVPAERQQYAPELQFDLALLDPQYQVPSYNFIGEKQHFPRIQPQPQPQIILYQGGAPAGQQPFLLQPGSPPGNFLVPQPGPNVILRNPQTPAQAPQRPLFVAGYPKPAHIPPIEKDAEEVPTNPSKIPPLTPKGEKKPEKLETFDEDTNKKQATEAEVLAAADRNPAFNTRTNLRPGQRFFILNGQPLFSNFPYNNQIYPGLNPELKFSPTFVPQAPAKNVSPFQNVLFRNGGQVDQKIPSDFHSYPENLVLLNQPGLFQDDVIFRSPAIPLNVEQPKREKPELREEVKLGDGGNFGFFQLKEEGQGDDDTVVIDARGQQDGEDTDTEAEVVSAADRPANEPTISQAQPGAIALAGPGGVAAAAPRGTAFVGKEGIAVSSPQATAVAGPSEKEPQNDEKNKKQNKRKQ